MKTKSPMACIIERVIPGSRDLTIRWVDGHVSIFHYLWLADNSPQSLNGRGQRLHDTTDLPGDIRPEGIFISSDNLLEIRWERFLPPSYFSTVWLRMHCYSCLEGNTQTLPEPGRHLASGGYRAEDDKPRLTTRHRSIGSSEDMVLMHAMRAVEREGLVKINGQNTMSATGSKAGFAGLIADCGGGCECELQGLWEMVSWYPQWSGMHTEHPERKQVPSLLHIHCLPSAPFRWELVLVDGFRLANALRTHHPEAFSLLASIPVQFKENVRQDDSAVFRSIIELDDEGGVCGVNFDHRSLAPFAIPPGQMLAYYEAYQTFGRMMRDPFYQRRCRVVPGTLFLLDNRRMLHGVLPATTHSLSDPDCCHAIDTIPDTCLMEV